MGYTAVVSREIGDTTEGFEWAAVDENRKVVEEVWDGGLGEQYIATKLEIQEKNNDRWEVSTRLDNIILEVYVTNSRVIVKCDRYDKGDSRWIGGFSALAMNAIERGIGAVRSRGKALIGHIRYEWLMAICYQKKTGWLSDNVIRLFYNDNEDRQNYVELTFKKNQDISSLANKVLHKAIAYRRSMTDEKAEEFLSFLKEYSDVSRLIPESNDSKVMSCLVFPDAYMAPFGSEFRPEKFVDSLQPAPLPYTPPDAQTVPGELPEGDNGGIGEKAEIRCYITKISSGEVISVNGDTFIIGRSPAKCDHVISDPTISSTHARIVSENGIYYIEDLNSSNHTFLNGEMIADRGRVPIRNGDTVILAKEGFKVEIK